MPDSREPVDNPPAFLAGLRQARRFQDRPVPAEVVAALLAAAHGESPGDLAWELRVIDDMATLHELAGAGAFTSLLAHVPVAIVIVSGPATASSKANDESRVGDRIMLEAGCLGLACGTGWFGTDEAKSAARDILGLRGHQTAWGAVGIGYPEDSPDSGEPALDRVRRLLDTLAPGTDSPTP